jgi:hypothetical protein
MSVSQRCRRDTVYVYGCIGNQPGDVVKGNRETLHLREMHCLAKISCSAIGLIYFCD